MEKDSGLDQWLAYHGINIKKELVVDSRHATFLVPMDRQVAGFPVRETRFIPYPFFVDICTDAMGKQGGITSGVDQVTL